MNKWLTPRTTLVALAVALVVALGVETDWGESFMTPAISLRPVNARQDAAGVLPDFKLSGDANAYGQIAEHPLLSPTRKPAPTQIVQAAPEPAKPLIRRGLYQLIGVSDLGDTKIGQVREIATGRVQSVRQGQSLQEMVVKKVDASSVTLAFASENDVLELPKYTASGRVPQPTPVPVQTAAPVPVPPVPGIPAPAPVATAAPAAPPPSINSGFARAAAERAQALQTKGAREITVDPRTGAPLPPGSVQVPVEYPGDALEARRTARQQR